MTTTQAQAINNLYQKVRELATVALTAKLAFDDPKAQEECFGNTLKIIDKIGLTIDDEILESTAKDLDQLVQNRYPEKFNELTEAIDNQVMRIVFGEVQNDPNKND